LRTVNGRLVGVGYGFASSFEKNHWRSNPLGNANTILKIAKKRSHVDAVLTGLGASNVFTQDIEDYEASQLEEPIEPSDGQFKLLATLISRYAAKFGKTPPAAEEALERIIGKKIKDLSKNEMHLLITFMSVVRLDNAKEVFEFILSKIHNNNSFWNVLKENSNLIEQLVQKRIIFDEFKKRFK
ncbi:MAG: hypothetical protein N2Z58_09375, partial [Fervidobacterium sp.]|nr:hypothetical protein [Fervidobacterium sp.]